jgi:hypothetical protein
VSSPLERFFAYAVLMILIFMPYLVAQHRFMSAARKVPELSNQSLAHLSRTRQSDTRLEALRSACNRWLVVSMLVFIATWPFIPWLFNS